jgi:hypothetical protein
MVRSASEGLFADFRRKIGWPVPPMEATPTATGTAKRVGIGIGVAPVGHTRVDDQRVLYKYFDLTETVSVLGYELREIRKP